MPRPIITTSWTPREKPNTEYKTPRDRSKYPVSFDSVQITFDSTDYTWDMISEDLGAIQTVYNTPRLGYKLRDLMNNFVFDLEGNQVYSIQGSGKNRPNIITNWI